MLLHVQGGRGAIAGDVDHLQGRQDHRRSEHRQRDDDQGRRSSERPPCVETRQVEPAGRPQLAHDQPGDEETGDDVEDVDADVATRQPGDASVVGDDQEDGDGPQPLDVRAKRRAAVRRCGR